MKIKFFNTKTLLTHLPPYTYQCKIPVRNNVFYRFKSSDSIFYISINYIQYSKCYVCFFLVFTNFRCLNTFSNFQSSCLSPEYQSQVIPQRFYMIYEINCSALFSACFVTSSGFWRKGSSSQVIYLSSLYLCFFVYKLEIHIFSSFTKDPPLPECLHYENV